MAALPRKHHLGLEQRHALQLLASSPFGTTETIMLAHDFTRRTLDLLASSRHSANEELLIEEGVMVARMVSVSIIVIPPNAPPPEQEISKQKGDSKAEKVRAGGRDDRGRQGADHGSWTGRSRRRRLSPSDYLGVSIPRQSRGLTSCERSIWILPAGVSIAPR